MEDFFKDSEPPGFALLPREPEGRSPSQPSRVDALQPNQASGPLLEDLEDPFNAKMEQLLGEIRQYEEDKNELTYQNASKRLDEIEETMLEVCAFAKQRLDKKSTEDPGAPWISVDRTAKKRWKTAAKVDFFATNGDWKYAAEFSEFYLDDWDGAVYYWRKFGGVEGYIRITTGSMKRMYESFYGRLDQKSQLRKYLPERLRLDLPCGTVVAAD